MNAVLDAPWVPAFPDSVRDDMGRYLQRYRSEYPQPEQTEATDAAVGPGFDHEELVDCLDEVVAARGNSACRVLTRICRDNIPYLIVAQEIGRLRDGLVTLANKDSNENAVGAILAFFQGLRDELAKTYLGHYLHTLAHRNHLRLQHISALAEKNLLVHFEKHLAWLEQLTAAVTTRDRTAMPEASHEQCEFGKWLLGEGAKLMRDKSHYRHLVETHAAMHCVVPEIDGMMGTAEDSLTLYALMKKAEHYSLNIGNEISLLNSMVIMINYNKDPMTGGLTRRSLERVMINQLEISRATETPFCLLMCDVDHFKQINDRHGHPVGDQALVHFAATLRNSLRQADLLFRFGGDEFLLMLPSTGYQQGLGVAEKLRAEVEAQPIRLGDEDVTLHASFGLLEVSGDKASFIDNELVRNLIKECDQRLYLAKHRGRNQIA